MEIIEKIKACKTIPELDALRIEIVQDKANFLKNQKAFIAQKNKLRKIPLMKRDWEN